MRVCNLRKPREGYLIRTDQTGLCMQFAQSIVRFAKIRLRTTDLMARDVLTR